MRISTGWRRTLSAAPAALAALVILAAAGCAGSSGIPHGTALGAGWMDGGMSGNATMKPGLELGMKDVLLHNDSHSPLTIESVSNPGRGVGTVIRVVQVKIAPFMSVGTAIGGGAFNTDPPVQWLPGGCRKQRLRPVHGYQLPPGGNVYIWDVIQAARPGSYNVPESIVDYTQNGHLYQEAIDTGYEGAVALHPKFIPEDHQETRCLKITGAALLPWFGTPGK